MIVPDDTKIYLVTGATDLRKGIDGYAMIIQDHLHMNPFDHCLYIFCNREHNKLKMLYWDSKGFWLLYYRLESGHFKWKKSDNESSIMITQQQYRWLLEGLKTDQKTSVKKVEKQYV